MDPKMMRGRKRPPPRRPDADGDFDEPPARGRPMPPPRGARPAMKPLDGPGPQGANIPLPARPPSAGAERLPPNLIAGLLATLQRGRR